MNSGEGSKSPGMVGLHAGRGRVPVAKAILWNLQLFRVNEIHRVPRVRPSVDQLFSGEDLADVLRGAWIIDDRVAFFGESDANHQVAAGRAGTTPQFVVANRQPDRNTGSDPILQLGNVRQSSDVAAHAGVG